MTDNDSLNWVFGGRGEENGQSQSYIQELNWIESGAGLSIGGDRQSSQE